MKNKFLPILLLLVSAVVFGQTKDKPVALGLPGDNLDLYAVLEIFKKSKTIEDFEKSLNAEKGPNNLDLDKDKKVDFIKVTTDKDDDSFSFILQDDISKTETQDVAVIFVSKDDKGVPSIQIVGDEDLYGKNYVVEPKGGDSSGNTPNPGYSGSGAGSSETMNLPTETAPTTTVVVQQQPPIVQYVYSPAYVPYYPPYYYGFPPPYFRPFATIAFGVFWANNFHCHGGYYGGYHGNVNINVNNSRHYNNYNNNSRNRSNTVNHYNRNGGYNNNKRTSNSINNRPSNTNRASTRPSTSNRASSANRASTRPSTSNNRASSSFNGASARPSTNNNAGRMNNSSSRPSMNNSSFHGGGGGRSSGGGFGGGGMHGGGGGGMRGGGGRR